MGLTFTLKRGNGSNGGAMPGMWGARMCVGPQLSGRTHGRQAGLGFKTNLSSGDVKVYGLMRPWRPAANLSYYGVRCRERRDLDLDLVWIFPS